MYSILRDCIDFHTKTLKRRDISITTLPKEFEITQLKKDVKDLVGNISINENRVRNVYNPTNVKFNPKGTQIINPPIEIKPEPPINIQPIEVPIQSEPIRIIEPPIEPQPAPIETIIPTPSYSGGGGGGYFERDFGTGFGRERIFDADMNQRENIQ
jgi:hypothetical protein